MSASLLLGGMTASLVGYGVWEYAKHRWNLSKIPIRIHVNGTRGKSGVTRLIAGGLRAGGIRTCAKTTGTAPRMIFSDGSEYPVFRPAKANVIEQVRIVDAAVADKAEALVMECMALQPELQSLCELKLLQSTHGVITNSRADHLEVMGPDTTGVAKALSGTMPRQGTLYTAEQHYTHVFEEAAQDRGSKVVAVSPDEIKALTMEEMRSFHYIEHPENVALALKVCQDLGVKRATALRGMWSMQPDPGVMTVHRLNRNGQELIFVNGFAANDPESTGCNWHLASHHYPHTKTKIMVVNCRSDRAERSIALGEACVDWEPADYYLVVGTETRLFQTSAASVGVNPMRITKIESGTTEQVLAELELIAGSSSLIVGMGNIEGIGWKLAEYFAQHGIADEEFSSSVKEAA